MTIIVTVIVTIIIIIITISMAIIVIISSLPVELSCEVVHVVNEKLLSVN